MIRSDKMSWHYFTEIEISISKSLQLVSQKVDRNENTKYRFFSCSYYGLNLKSHRSTGDSALLLAIDNSASANQLLTRNAGHGAKSLLFDNYRCVRVCQEQM